MTIFRALKWVVAASTMLAFAACGGNQSGQNSSGGGDTTATASSGGASGGSASGGKVRLDFWHYFGGDHIKTMKEMIAEFEKANPDITINPVYQGRPQELAQKLNGSFATTPSNNPILSTVYESWTDDYVSKGFMEAVQDHFDGPDGLTKEEQDDFIKVFRDANTWNGKMITLPFNKSVYVTYMNLDKLATAGYTTAPKNLTELKDAVTKLTDTGAGRKSYGYGVAPVSEAFTTLLYASGGEYISADGNVAFNSPEGLAALNFLRELAYPDKKLYVTSDYMDQPFGNQMISMYTYSSASFPYNAKSVGDKFKWAVSAVPGADGKESRSLMQGTNIGIFKNKPDNEKKAAWKFLKFITSPKQCVYWETRTGYMPIRYSVVNDPEMQAYMQSNPRYGAASSLVLSDKGKQEPRMALWEGVRDDLNIMVDRVLNRPDADVKTELEATAKKVSDRLAALKK